jgi:hypothetical protein
MAYLLVDGLRRLALTGTDLARAQVWTIRLHLLKIGAQLRMTVRRIWISMATSYPRQQLFQHAWDRSALLKPLRRDPVSRKLMPRCV